MPVWFRIHVKWKLHESVWKTNVTVEATKVALPRKQVVGVRTGRYNLPDVFFVSNYVALSGLC